MKKQRILFCLMMIGATVLFLFQRFVVESSETEEAGTLILVGFASDGIVMAADSGVFENGKLTRHARKIVPVGKSGAIALIGFSRLEMSQNTVINFRKMLGHCAMTTDNIESAETCLTNIIALPPGTEVTNVEGDRLVRYYLAGYVRGNRESIELEYSIDPKTRLVQSEPKVKMFLPNVGYFVGIGRNGVVSKAIHGNIPELKKNEAVNTILNRNAHGTLNLYTVTEMKSLFSTLLNITESELGQRYDKDAKLVAGPNIVIIVDPQQGVHSERLP